MNYKNIKDNVLKDFQTQIAISNLKKGELNMDKSKRFNYTFGKVAAILVLAIFLTGATFSGAQIIIDRFENRETIYSIGSIKEAIEDGYIENIDMEYAYSNDDIGVKINSLMISDNNLNIILDFDFKRANVPEDILWIGYLIYDENYNLYDFNSVPNSAINKKNLKQFYKEANITNYDKNDLLGDMYSNDSAGGIITKTDERFIIEINFNTKKKLPKSNKIYVKIFALGTTTDSGKFKPISKSEWNLQVNVPEKFLNRYSIDYELKESVEDFELISAYVSETHMTVIAKTEDLKDLLSTVKIVDKNGKEFTQETSSSVIDENTFITKYSLNKSMIPEKLYIKTRIFGKETITELIRKD